MKTTMNIFDLFWCKFYLHDERFNIGFPLFGASVSMATFVGMYLVGLAIFPASIGVYKLPHLPFWPFAIGYGIIIAFFLIRHRDRINARKDWTDISNIKNRILVRIWCGLLVLSVPRFYYGLPILQLQMPDRTSANKYAEKLNVYYQFSV